MTDRECGSISLSVDDLDVDQIPITDRGLLYGDGIFETLAVLEGQPCCWQAHMARMRLGTDRLGFPAPEPTVLLRSVRRLTGSATGRLRITLTRGDGPPGYRTPQPPRPRSILRFDAQPLQAAADRPHAPVRLRLCTTRIGISPALAGIKHLNRLEQVLARQEWDDPGIFEGLMQDVEGQLVCGTATNLFLLRPDGILITPRLDRAGIAGTVRALVLEEAQRLGLPCQEARVNLASLRASAALFVTNALNGLVPAKTCEEQTFNPEQIPLALIEAVQRRAFSISENPRLEP